MSERSEEIPQGVRFYGSLELTTQASHWRVFAELQRESFHYPLFIVKQNFMLHFHAAENGLPSPFCKDGSENLFYMSGDVGQQYVATVVVWKNNQWELSGRVLDLDECMSPGTRIFIDVLE